MLDGWEDGLSLLVDGREDGLSSLVDGRGDGLPSNAHAVTNAKHSRPSGHSSELRLSQGSHDSPASSNVSPQKNKFVWQAVYA